MLNIDLKARLRNKAFWAAMASAIALLAQQLGFDIIPSNYSDIVNTVLGILTIVGIMIDPSSSGLSDQIKTNKTDIVQTSDSEENKTTE